jgi:hypothetical protein
MVHTIDQFKQEMKLLAAFYRMIASKPRVENQRTRMVEKQYPRKWDTNTPSNIMVIYLWYEVGERFHSNKSAANFTILPWPWLSQKITFRGLNKNKVSYVRSL